MDAAQHRQHGKPDQHHRPEKFSDGTRAELLKEKKYSQYCQYDLYDGLLAHVPHNGQNL